MPNITGVVGVFWGGDADGAFSSKYFDPAGGASGGGDRQKVRFNASLSNKIYGKSDTVQPKNITIKLWKRIS